MPHPFDPSAIEAAARRALISAAPDYFSWDTERRERFHADAGGEAREALDRAMITALTGKKCDDDEAWEETEENLEPAQLYALNWARLLISGIGEDRVFLNESMAEGVTLLNFETVYDYDLDNHRFQQKANAEQFPDHAPEPYEGGPHWIWARMIIDRRLNYATLTSLAHHVMNEVEEAMYQRIDELIPHRHVDGPNHGKESDGGFLWDMRIDAGGLEGQLDELQHRTYDYIAELYRCLNRRSHTLKRKIYLLDTEDHGDPMRTFIFAHPETLKRVRWRHFLADCSPMTAAADELRPMIDREAKRMIAYLDEQYADVMEHFDPKVVKFRKKRKVVFASGAVEDLARILAEEGDEDGDEGE